MPARTARHRLELAALLAGHPDLAARVDAGTLSARRVRQYAHQREPARAIVDPGAAVAPTVDLRAGDFRRVLADVPDGGVDLIYTDPRTRASTCRYGAISGRWRRGCSAPGASLRR